jgi:uncharacterized protein (DUF4415 family)
MRTFKEPQKKRGGSSSDKLESVEPAVAEVLVVEKEPAETVKEEHVEVPVASTLPQAPPANPEKKRKGRAPSEGEPLKRVLVFLGSKEIDALRAQAGGRGVSTRIREILKECIARQG